MSAQIPIETRFRAAFGECLKATGARRIGLAVSGGSDSIALMNMAAAEARRIGIFVEVLCFDHAIKGENSAEESRFVADCATRLGLPVFLRRADPPVAAGGGLSLEMAAREARMAFFGLAARDLRLDAVATGHQRDDAAESLLMRLLRGAGATGLSAMRPVSPPTSLTPAIIRPMLDFGRSELRGWLAARGLAWMDDVSNSNEEIQRCRVRLRLIPEIARLMELSGEDVARSLAQSAAILRDDDACLEAIASAGGDSAAKGADASAIDLPGLSREAPAIARRRVRQWLMGKGLFGAAGFSTVREILAAAPGSTVNLPGNAVADVDSAGCLRIRGASNDVSVPAQVVLAVPGKVRWGEYSVAAMKSGTVVRRRQPLGEWPASCTLSASAVAAFGPLSVRARREGDRMRPFGVKGSKRLQDIFVDLKIPAARRGSWPIVCAGDEIAWIPGYRIAAPFAAVPGGENVELTVDPVPLVAKINHGTV